MRNIDEALNIETRRPLSAEVRFHQRSRQLTSKYIDLWQSVGETTPCLGEIVGERRQRATALEAERLLNDVAIQVERYPDTDRERRDWREKLKEQLRRFGQKHLGWPDGYRRLLLADGFYETTARFAREARAFDPSIRGEDVAQALRNVWIVASIQMLLDLEVTLSPATFAYSMLYPYTDNFLDDPNVLAEVKRDFNHRLGGWLAEKKSEPVGSHERDVLRLIELIEGEFPRTRFPEVYSSLLAIHQAQLDSLEQQLPSLDDRKILRISVAKGGASLLADGYLASGTASREEADFYFGYGTVLQFLDDLQDVKADGQANHSTVFTLRAETGPLDGITSRLYHFMHQVLAHSKRFVSPDYDDRKDLILRNCTFLLVGAVAENSELFTPHYVKQLEARWPLDFKSMKRLRRLASRRLKKAGKSLLRRKRVESVFQLL